MDVRKCLVIAGVPTDLHNVAEKTINEAKKRAKGLLWFKIKVRFFKNKEIAKQLKWENNRLIEVRPEWADYDIAPMLNITCNGDDGTWHDNVGIGNKTLEELGITTDSLVFKTALMEGRVSYMVGRPDEDFYCNPNPESEEYKAALNSKYAKGRYHPRSEKFRAMWYRRNGGEYKAWRLGMPVNTETGNIVYKGTKGNLAVTVYNSGQSWLIKTKRKIGPVFINTRVGFECDNVFSGQYAPQMWYPIPGKELLAPITSSTLPSLK